MMFCYDRDDRVNLLKSFSERRKRKHNVQIKENGDLPYHPYQWIHGHIRQVRHDIDIPGN